MPTPVTLVASGRAPHPHTFPPRSEQDPNAWWAALRVRLGSGPGSPQVAAIAVAGQQHGMVATRRRRRRHPAGEALERHRVRARRRLADQAARRCGRVGRGGAAACRSPPSRSPSCRGCTAASPSMGAAAPGAAAPRLAHVAAHGRLHDRPRRRVGHGLLVAGRGRYRVRPAGDRRRRARLEADRARGARTRGRAGLDRRVPAVVVVASARATTWPPRWASGSAPGDVAMSLGTSGTVYAVSEQPTADADGRGGRVRRRHRPLPAPRLHAERDEGHRRRRRACSASTTTVSTPSRSTRRQAPAASPCCPTSTASARRTGRTRPGSISGLRSDVTQRAARPGRVRGRGVRAARRHRRARRRGRATRGRPHRARRRRRPLTCLPSHRR